MTKDNENNVIEFSEAQMKKLARNALLTAGHEMGEDGDHWPVIKNTIVDIMKDWEDLAQEREVDAVLKEQLYAQLAELEAGLPECAHEDKVEAEALFAEIRELMDAYFEAPEVIEIDTEDNDNEKPVHIKRAEAILETLMED